MPTITSQVILYKNSMLLQLVGLQNGKTLDFVNDATVTVTLVDDAGVEVVGETWPLTMTYVATSDGDYDAVLLSTLEVTLDKMYTAQISATDTGGLKGYWELPLMVKVRKFI